MRLIAVLLAAILLLGCAQHEAATSSTPETTSTEAVTPFSPQFGVKYRVRVLEVIDGDTIDVLLPGGSVERIRMLCVDTPEKAAEDNEPYEYDGITDLECLAEYGREATRFTEQHLLGKDVYIEFDETAGLRGYYGRLLAYVYLENGTDFTAELVKRGLARVYEEGECKKEAEYLEYQRQATEQNLGLWKCRGAATECDPSYPDVCIPPPPPDLDCKDIPYRNFRVLPPDPHNFDADGDGIGCESR